MLTELEIKLLESDAHRTSRISACNYAIRKEKIEELTQIAFNLYHQSHVMAFWTLEFVCEKKLKSFVPFINSFCEVLPTLKNDSAIRPATKICFFLAKSNHRKNGISLTHDQEHNLIETLIDRLIQDEKVAAKVYCMKALFVFGKKYDWINNELKEILVQDFPNHSAAYKSASRNLLKKLNK
ncbi:hypothetical protein [Flavobacterium haoranii]|uniref:Adenylosuccinate lyase n=1 Tax=Flavobacterium haoranii TaxID=683124 RepID=A0A1M6JAD9_9FLAO|nr:hypothetical protein [Flavobacterium haoranii]SHJ43648.1 hypothetical protein SAMN05444337_2021 [Flavobacterium haoranii]